MAKKMSTGNGDSLQSRLAASRDQKALLLQLMRQGGRRPLCSRTLGCSNCGNVSCRYRR